MKVIYKEDRLTTYFAVQGGHPERRWRVTVLLSPMKIAVHPSLLFHVHDVSWQNTYR